MDKGIRICIRGKRVPGVEWYSGIKISILITRNGKTEKLSLNKGCHEYCLHKQIVKGGEFLNLFRF